jgi:hypothetical protein
MNVNPENRRFRKVPGHLTLILRDSNAALVGRSGL